MKQSKMSHKITALRVIKYIKLEPGKRLLMSADHIPHLTGYCDANWIICPNTRRLGTCFYLKFGDSLITGNPKSGILSIRVVQRLSIGGFLV